MSETEVHATFEIELPVPSPGETTGLPGSLINRPCTIENPDPSGSVDERGNDTGGYLAAIDGVVEIQQQQREEATDRGVITRTVWAAYFPAGTVVRSGARITVDDGVYEVDGVPWEARNPRTQAVSHIEATLVRTGGADDEAS